MVSILVHMGQIILNQTLTGYLAPLDFEEDLKTELTLMGIEIVSQHGRLFLCRGSAQDVVFAQDTWKNVEILPYTSISNAAELLSQRHVDGAIIQLATTEELSLFLIKFLL